MRTRDKFKNIEKANLMLEQSYLKSKRLIKENEQSIKDLISNLKSGRRVTIDGATEKNISKFNMLKMSKLKTISESESIKLDGINLGNGESFVAISELTELKFFVFKIYYIDNGNKIIIHRDMDGELKKYLPNFISLKIDGYFGATENEDGFVVCKDIYRGSCIKHDW